MNSVYLAVICLLMGSVHAATSPRALYNSLVLSEADVQDAFDGLNAHRDKELNLKDLDVHYYHKDTGFAKAKFIDLADTKTKDGKIDKEELTAFLNHRPVTNAVWECKYVHSESLREYCFADQILTYVLLCIDTAAIEVFYNAVEDETDVDNVITADDLKKLAVIVPSFDSSQQRIFLMELGGDDLTIDFVEFKDYVEQEEMQDDFRRCRKSIEGVKGKYDNNCLIKQLIAYTLNDITELEMATLFIKHDLNKDDSIDKDELVKGQICNEVVAEKFIRLMDKTGDGSVCYGEFRTYLKTPSVKLHLKIECAVVFQTQDGEMACFMGKISDLIVQNHKPIWMKKVDLDIVILFEELDTTNDGVIELQNDLISGKRWSYTVANKMVYEMDGIDDDTDVTLEEFMGYVSYPNMVYALNDCLYNKRGTARTSCYENELKDVISVMLEKNQVKAFFSHFDAFDNKIITKKEIEAKGIFGDDANNLLVEMGMGDMEINYLEFFWFVRQQRISHMFQPTSKYPKSLQPILMNYINKVMTEHETEGLFAKLDTDGDWELSTKDFSGDAHDIVQLITAMDAISDDQDRTVNFYEFWIFLNTPFDDPRKGQLEKKCKIQKKGLVCYGQEIVAVK